MEQERKVVAIITMLTLVGIPSVLLIMHMPHEGEYDYSMIYAVAVAVVILVSTANLLLNYPRSERLLPSVPPLFFGMIFFSVAMATGIFFSGGRLSPFFYMLLLVPLISGMYHDIKPALILTVIAAALFLLSSMTAPDSAADARTLSSGTVYLFMMLLISKRVSQEFRRQKDARKEILSLSDFIRKLERAKTEYVSIVSHELRTPLTSIQGFSEMLKSRRTPEEKKAEYYEIILKESERLSKLISNLLDLSRLEAGVSLNKEPTKICALIAEDISIMKGQSEMHDFVLDTDGSIESLIVDPDRFRQIIRNLISNSIKFSPHGGKITVSVKRSGKYAEIAVIDNGIGIKAEELPLVFERFTRTEDAAQIGGTGLGLAIVKHIVEMHDGNIKIESEPGKGTKFSIYFPL